MCLIFEDHHLNAVTRFPENCATVTFQGNTPL